jgi:CRP/FNR family transcriptional regulator, cyclic AMP receptor protein
MSNSASSPNQLPALGFLAGIPEEHRSFLACYGRYHRPQEGETVIVEGAAQDSLYVILAGRLHIVAGTSGDRPMLLAALEPGDSIGEINLFDPGTASASAIARGSALIWSLSRAELDSFLEADAVIGVSVLRALLGQMSKRIRIMNDKLATAEKKSSLHDFWSNTPQ